MPIYEYKCKKCGEEFEVFQRITSPDVRTCKFCKGPVNKLISLSSFSLKGTGWYATDYGGKKAPPPSKKEDTTVPAADSSPKTESKVESKKE